MTFVTNLTRLSSSDLITAQTAWNITWISHFLSFVFVQSIIFNLFGPATCSTPVFSSFSLWISVFSMVVLAPMICFTEIKQFWPFLCNFLHYKHRWIGMFSDATEFVVLFCHHLGFWHSGMINITTYYEPSPVLIRALPPDANASHSSLRQELPAVQCPLRQSCSPGGHQVVQLSIHQQWRHEKSKWEGRKNTFNR